MEFLNSNWLFILLVGIGVTVFGCYVAGLAKTGRYMYLGFGIIAIGFLLFVVGIFSVPRNF